MGIMCNLCKYSIYLRLFFFKKQSFPWIVYENMWYFIFLRNKHFFAAKTKNSSRPPANWVRYCDADRVLKCVLTARKHERPFVILDNVFLHRHVIFVIYAWNSLIYYCNGMDMGIFQPERSARCILIVYLLSELLYKREMHT